MTKLVRFALALHGLLRWLLCYLLRFFLLWRFALRFRWFSCLLLLRFAKIEVSWAACAKVEYKRFNKIGLEHFRYAASHIFYLLVRIISKLLVLKLILPMLLCITHTLQISTLHTTNALVPLVLLLSSASVNRGAYTSLVRMLSLNSFRKESGVRGYNTSLREWFGSRGCSINLSELLSWMSMFKEVTSWLKLGKRCFRFRDVLAQPLFEFFFHFFFNCAEPSFCKSGCKVGGLVLMLKLW